MASNRLLVATFLLFAASSSVASSMLPVETTRRFPTLTSGVQSIRLVSRDEFELLAAKSQHTKIDKLNSSLTTEEPVLIEQVPHPFSEGRVLTQLIMPQLEAPAVPHEKNLERDGVLDELPQFGGLLNSGLLQEAEHFRVTERVNGRDVHGHIFRVPSPLQVDVLQPLGGCGGGLSTVSETSRNRCLFATTGGFFNVTSGACIGNVVSRGRVIQTSTRFNVNFGVRQSGEVFVGHIMPPDVIDTDNPFISLIAGLVWLVRDGESYWEQSMEEEDQSSQTNGPEFATLLSGRTAVGVDNQGRVVLVSFDGRSFQYGINLPEMTDVLLELGVINAINLDGGGSVAAAVNGGQLVSYPSDLCTPVDLPLGVRCERPTSTIMCVSLP